MDITAHERLVILWLRDHIDIGDSIDRMSDIALGAVALWPEEDEWKAIGEFIRLLKKASVTRTVTERPSAEAGGDARA